MLVKVEFSRNMCVVDAKSVAVAVHHTTKKFGEYQCPYVGKKATEADVNWFQAFGGHIEKI